MTAFPTRSLIGLLLGFASVAALANLLPYDPTRSLPTMPPASNLVLPPELLGRKKRGFAVNVVDQWFDSSLEGVLPSMLLDDGSLMFETLEPKAVRRLLDDHRSGRHDNHKVLFSLVMFEQWLRQTRSHTGETLATL